MNLKDTPLDSMQELAREAGEILMNHWRELDGYEKKGPIDLVTVADTEAEEFLTKDILTRFPGHAILAEEGGRKGNQDSDWLWVVDPLDGTTNFAHGLPVFAVSIALLRKNEIVAGVVFAPALGELYAAELGAGARRNGKPIQVSQTNNLEESLVVTGFPYNRTEQIDMLSKLHRAALLNTQGVLRLGAAAYDFSLIAAGHLEAFYECGLSPWDMGAGVLLVREAGGTVTAFQPDQPFDIFTPRMLASNGRIHEPMRELLLANGAGRAIEFYPRKEAK